MDKPSKEWVMYRRTSAVGDVEFFIRTKEQWASNQSDSITDRYKREIMFESDDYALAKKALRLAQGE